MISKILRSTVVLTSVFYVIGCCGVSCRWIAGAEYDITFPDGTVQRIVAEERSDGNGCLTYDCELGDPTKIQVVVNPQV